MLGTGFGLLTVHNGTLAEYRSFNLLGLQDRIFFDQDNSVLGLTIVTWLGSVFVLLAGAILIALARRPDQTEPSLMSEFAPSAQ